MKAPEIEGSRIRLRPLRRPDAARIVAILNDPDVRRTLRPLPVLTVAAEEAFIEGIEGAAHDLVVGIAAREDDRIVGVVGLHHLDHPARQGEFGIFVGPPSEWRKGYGEEATRLILRHGFEALALNRIWLHVHADHAGAIALYARIGFRPEGLLRQGGARDDGLVDVVAMGILRSEWAAGAVPR
jgi:[ribosomal protein S5]-alanine N-acetyltransferase